MQGGAEEAKGKVKPKKMEIIGVKRAERGREGKNRDGLFDRAGIVDISDRK